MSFELRDVETTVDWSYWGPHFKDAIEKWRVKYPFQELSERLHLSANKFLRHEDNGVDLEALNDMVKLVVDFYFWKFNLFADSMFVNEDMDAKDEAYFEEVYKRYLLTREQFVMMSDIGTPPEFYYLLGEIPQEMKEIPFIKYVVEYYPLPQFVPAFQKDEYPQ